MSQKPDPQKPKKRRHRFQKLPKHQRQRFLIQERDIDIARIVHEHYQLNSHHIRALISGLNVPTGRLKWNAKKITERLPRLCDEGIIEKIESDYEFTNALYRPDCYQLGPQGEKLLRMRGQLNESAARLVAKNREGRFTTLPHRIMINDIYVSIQIALQRFPNIQLIKPGDIIAAAPEPTRCLKNPFEIPSFARYQHPRSKKWHSIKTGIIPDKLFGLQNIKTGRQLFIMLEAHRTVPLTDINPKRKTVLKSLAAYLRINVKPKNDQSLPLYRKHFGIPNMIVLWATTSEQKAANILNLIEHLTDGRPTGLFGVTCLSLHQNPRRSPVPDPDILQAPWQRSGRDDVTLLDLLNRT